MASITAVLRTNKINKQGTAPIYLRIADRDSTVYRSLGERVKPSQWNDNKAQVRASHDNADELNALIESRIAEAKREVIRIKTGGEEVRAGDIKEALAPTAPGIDFFAYAEHVAADHEARGSYQRAQKLRTVARKLKGFTRSPLPFNRITPALLKGFETHLLTKYSNGANTVRANFNAVRAIVYQAIREGLADQGSNPFFSFKPVKEQRAERGKLTEAELTKIEALPLKEGTLTWRVRAYFLFCFYCAGIRYGDLAHLRWEHVTPEEGGHLRLSYRMSKTSGLKSLRLLPQARAILAAFPERKGSPYLFPILDGYDLSTPRKLRSAVSSQTALANKYLKKIGERAEVGCKLTTHIARHSFADIARARGWDIYSISKALGHANLKVTENYLKGFDTSALDEKMQALFAD